MLKISYKRYIVTLNINVNAKARLQYRMYTFYVYLSILFSEISCIICNVL